MNEPTINNMLQRLDRLERENHRLKRIGALVVVVIAAVVLMGQARPSKVAKVIEAEKFVLRDTSGQVGAILFTLYGGSPHLEFRDKKGNLRITLGVMFDVAHLSLFSENGNSAITLRALPDGSPHLQIYDKDRITRAVLGSTSPRVMGIETKRRPESSLVLFDKKGKVIWSAP